MSFSEFIRHVRLTRRRALALLGSSAVAPAAQSQTVATDPQRSSLGFGYFLLEGRSATNRAIKTDSAFTSPGRRISATFTRLDWEQTDERLFSASVGASATLAVGGFRADAQVRQMSRIEQNETAFYCEVVVEAGQHRIPLASLTPEALQLLRGSETSRFWNVFGDHYVSEVVKGGRLSGVVFVSGRNSTEVAEYLVRVTGSYGLASGSGSVSERLQTLSKTASLRIAAKIEGARLTIPTDVRSFIQAAEEFDSKVSADAVETRITLTSYSSVAASSTDSSKLPDIQNAKAAIVELARRIRRADTARTVLAYGLQRSEEFMPFDHVQSQRSLAALSNSINSWQNEAKRIEATPLNVPASLPAIDETSFAYPRRRPKVQIPLEISGWWGGYDKGTAFEAAQQPNTMLRGPTGPFQGFRVGGAGKWSDMRLRHQAYIAHGQNDNWTLSEGRVIESRQGSMADFKSGQLAG